MKVNKVHCLFEQSGTFRDVFRKYGIDAYDYDIKNDFGCTDRVIDLFQEIEKGFNGDICIFDSFVPGDLLFAFFPCIRFENQIMLGFRGQAFGMSKWSDLKKFYHCMKLQDELTHFYMLVNKLFIICHKRNLRLILENPYSQEHYLRRYWFLKPTIIDTDRRLRGDYFKKPTQYYFYNCVPSNNILPLSDSFACFVGTQDSIRTLNKDVCKKVGALSVKVARSMISPVYADRFVREFIFDEGFANERDS